MGSVVAGSVLVLVMLLSAPEWFGNGLVVAHPGAVADGRGTCGTEYSSPESAYVIPDVSEAWFLRRIATCEQPVFWNSFNITAPNQKLYIAVISPELARFEDKLKFNAILYGPGVSSTQNGLSDVPTLPAGIELMSALGPAAFMQSPDDLGDCAFVDTNPVMRQFSDVHNGRCMEKLDLSANYKDDLQANTTSWSWWLYSYNHNAAEAGTYYLQTWLTDAASGAVAQGKYEITLGPWTWYGYASEATLSAAQEQGTACTCALNALHYKENYPHRLGVAPALFSAELPGGSCAASPPPASACVTQARRPFMSQDSAVEWAGLYDLQGGRTYRWTFNAYMSGKDGSYGYPDPGITVVVVSAPSLAAATPAADDELSRSSAEPSVVGEGGTVAVQAGAQWINFTAPSAEARATTVLIRPAESGTVAVVTEHVPAEFMAHFLVDDATGDLLFPTDATLYADITVVQGPGGGGNGDGDDAGGKGGAGRAGGGQGTGVVLAAAVALVLRLTV